jgi:hypothetical protein
MLKTRVIRAAQVKVLMPEEVGSHLTVFRCEPSIE